MRASFSTRKFDVDFTENFFKGECRRIFRLAAVDFVQTAAANFPTLTGQARAAFINVANSIGVDPGVGEFDPPISDYEHLQVPLWLAGNTPARGKKMGKSTLRNNKKSVTWTVNISITAAHNGFAYFTYWDNSIWHSIEQGQASAIKYLDSHWTNAVQLRLTGWKKS